MDQTNVSVVKYFIIAGISEVPMIRIIIFLLVLLIFVLTFGGNLSIVLLVCLDPQLHTPMYFFLCNLSIVDITCSTNNLHNLLLSFLSGDNTVSVLRCTVQIFIFLSLTCGELLILAAMSYDRYMAICNPLHYNMIMNGRLCTLLAIMCWGMGTVESIPIFLELLRVSCYKSNMVNHFFCDIMPVLKLSCSDARFLDLYILTVGVVISAFCPFLMTCVSYVFIIVTILKIRSTTGRRKAFYTCSSHLTVVSLLYTTLAIQYMRPHSLVNLGSNKLISLFNTAAVPILNPLIYSLRNKDIKAAFRRRMRWDFF
ncbi:olfactory receptor 1019-like [Hyla sarda]|uniref:olfactory receptor 1019-like n=1 Tax=Hyla sarda TaxID=327740 RepID=UPI0024C2A883|nr:olfactory receptor 1019-like [Hyla sarda]